MDATAAIVLRYVSFLALIFLVKVEGDLNDIISTPYEADSKVAASISLSDALNDDDPRAREVENSCKNARIKRNQTATCVSAGSKCHQKKGESCCSAVCVPESEKGSAANRKFSCSCQLSKKRDRCNVDADCDISDCSERRKNACCDASIFGTKRCKCSRDKCSQILLN